MNYLQNVYLHLLCDNQKANRRKINEISKCFICDFIEYSAINECELIDVK